ncbi:TPA: LysR substrate-binding domain-containing protein [Photobacterium damselae]
MRTSDDLILFYHLIEHGSFSKAAEQAGITKSVISKRISKLEADLGVQLIYRTTRKLTPTEAGIIFYSHARDVYHSVQNAMNAMSGLEESISGTIKITVPTISGEMILPQAISEFSQQYPDIKIEMDLDNRFVDIIDKGFDLAIRTGALPDSSLIARKLINAHWIICASPAYLHKYGLPQHASELTSHNCLGYSYQGTGASEWLINDNQGIHTMTVKGNFTTNNASALRQAALLGQGIIYVPKILVSADLANGDLQEILSGQAAKHLGIYAVYPYTKQQAIKIKLFIEHLHKCYQQHKNLF